MAIIRFVEDFNTSEFDGNSATAKAVSIGQFVDVQADAFAGEDFASAHSESFAAWDFDWA